MTTSETGAAAGLGWLNTPTDPEPAFGVEWGRRCLSCQEMKAWNEFGPSRKNITGHVGRCKPCEAERVQAWRAAYKQSPRPFDAAGRTCTACQSFLPWEDYGLNASGTNGRRSKCKVCCAGYARERYAQRYDDAHQG